MTLVSGLRARTERHGVTARRGTGFGLPTVDTEDMGAMILILETRQEVAAALEDVISSASYTAVVRPHLERLSDLAVRPAAIVVRIAFEGMEPAHAAIAKLPDNRPPIVAIACDDAEYAEAHRLKCDVVLRGSKDVGQLCDVLHRLVQAGESRMV